MNRLKLLLLGSVLSVIGCSGDDSTPINEISEPTNPSGQLLLLASVQAPHSGWTNNHIRIRRLKSNGDWEFISQPPLMGIERPNEAFVNRGDKIRIVYDIGIDQNQCCILYNLKQGHTVKKTELKCASNTVPFFTYFEFEVE